ncbi:uncharacterized protein LOC128079511 [Tympanuchus pallidicinctus]|uniref:uncharacterized protein LOC128079511 n=1 Tax=Tympanuchus pallidicinctus TaxID=109042 RepID=UPI002286F765|nr:uncharacterized protein LOC128079511 [Tympanuchus pallidicinctus]
MRSPRKLRNGKFRPARKWVPRLLPIPLSPTESRYPNGIPFPNGKRVGLEGSLKIVELRDGRVGKVFKDDRTIECGRAQLGESHLAGEEHIWAGQPLAGPGSVAPLHGSARCSGGITGTGAKRAVPEPFRCSERRRDFTTRNKTAPVPITALWTLTPTPHHDHRLPRVPHGLWGDDSSATRLRNVSSGYGGVGVRLHCRLCGRGHRGSCGVSVLEAMLRENSPGPCSNRREQEQCGGAHGSPEEPRRLSPAGSPRVSPPIQ